MKRPLSLLLPLAILLATPPSRAALDRAEFVALGPSVLRVEAPRARGGFALGSAVVVAPEQVVTNCHVTRDAREINVVRGGVRLPAAAQASDLARDLCLLHVPGLQASAVRLRRSAELAIGQSVTALGYTGGMGLQNSAGEVVDLHRHDGSRVIRSSNWFGSAPSGGGLFDDEGRLVGILTFRLRGGAKHYFAAPTEWVQQMIEAGEFRRVTPLDPLQQAFWQLDATAQPHFLQAALLQRDDRWSELAGVAEQWLRSDAADAEPWTLLGIALARLGDGERARRAFECALQLEPDRPAARAQLARLPAAPSGAAGPCVPDPH